MTNEQRRKAEAEEKHIGERVRKVWTFLRLVKAAGSTKIVILKPDNSGSTEPKLFHRMDVEDWENKFCIADFMPPELRHAVNDAPEGKPVDLSLLDWPKLFDKMFPLEIFNKIAKGMRGNLVNKNYKSTGKGWKRRKGGGRKRKGGFDNPVTGEEIRLLVLAHLEHAVADTSKKSTGWFHKCSSCKHKGNTANTCI